MQQVGPAYAFACRDIREGAGEFDGLVSRSDREVVAFVEPLQQGRAIVIEPAVSPQVGTGHLGVAGYAFPCGSESVELAFAGSDHRIAQRGGSDGPGHFVSIIEFDPPHIFLHVDAVQDRSRYPLAVGADGMGRAFAPAGPRVSTGTGVHRRHQHEIGGIAVLLVHTADRHPSLLQGKPQRFEGLPAEFGQLVQKEDAAVGERHFPRFGVGTPADERLGGHVVVGCAERSGTFQLVSVQLAGNAVDGGHLEYLILAHGRQDGGEQLGHHRLA